MSGRRSSNGKRKRMHIIKVPVKEKNKIQKAAQRGARGYVLPDPGSSA